MGSEYDWAKKFVCGSSTSSVKINIEGNGSVKSSDKDPFKSRCEPKKKVSECHESHRAFREQSADNGREDGTVSTSTKASSRKEELNSDCKSYQKERSKESSGICSDSKDRCTSSPPLGRTKDENKSFKDGSVLSKLQICCNKFGEDSMKSTATLESREFKCKKDLVLPFTKPHSNPIVEKGIQPESYYKTYFKKQNSTSLPEQKAFPFARFFPLDECTERYAKIDPSQEVNKCSQLTNKTAAVSGKCMSAVNVKNSDDTKKFTGFRVSPRTRHLAGRWAPTAAVLLTATALYTAYATREPESKD